MIDEVDWVKESGKFKNLYNVYLLRHQKTLTLFSFRVSMSLSYEGRNLFADGTPVPVQLSVGCSLFSCFREDKSTQM